VLYAAARGLGNKQIGVELGMSARTVQTHLTSVFAKLGVSSRTEAVLLAVKRGWVRADLT
jgi:NarL family two-component system response regulator YdfI